MEAVLCFFILWKHLSTPDQPYFKAVTLRSVKIVQESVTHSIKKIKFKAIGLAQFEYHCSLGSALR